MSAEECSLLPEHYKTILGNAITSGYSFKFFGEEVAPFEKPLYLRHDVDVSLDFAVQMAELEATMGIKSTYLVLHNSPLYNLLEDNTVRSMEQLFGLGHKVGLHIDLDQSPIFPGMALGERIRKLRGFFSSIYPLDNVVSFHWPGRDIIDRKLGEDLLNTYEPQFFSRIKYLSDSNGVWREGCPCRSLEQSQYDGLQLLIHPVWWSGYRTTIEVGKHVVMTRQAETIDYLGKEIPPFEVLQDM